MGAKLPKTLRVDPELARLSIGLHVASQFRLWTIARQLTRSADGSSKVHKRDLKSALRHYKIAYTRQHLNKLMRAGEGIFWNVSRKRLYIRSGTHVATCLTQQALETYPDLLQNKPGVTDVLLSPAGSLERWEAMIYAGWLKHRNNPTISREVLQLLFNRTADTLHRWETEHLEKHLHIRSNYAQCAFYDTAAKVQPARLNSYIAQTRAGNALRLIWQLPNTYLVKGIKTHPHKGQSKTVRKAVNHQLYQPANLWRGGSPAYKLYFDSPRRLQDHLKTVEGVYYLWRGENRHQHGIFEATENGWSETHPNERVSFHRERQLKAAGQVRMMG